jgi:hypothetical protein
MQHGHGLKHGHEHGHGALTLACSMDMGIEHVLDMSVFMSMSMSTVAMGSMVWSTALNHCYQISQDSNSLDLTLL